MRLEKINDFNFIAEEFKKFTHDTSQLVAYHGIGFIKGIVCTFYTTPNGQTVRRKTYNEYSSLTDKYYL